MEIHTLIYSDGYGIYPIDHDTNLDTLKTKLNEKYAEYTPEDWDPEWEDMSCLNDTDAILYANGENVYVWNILTFDITNLLAATLVQNVFPLIDNMPQHVRTQITDYLQLPSVLSDITTYAEKEFASKFSTEELKLAAKRYVVDKRYDCNLSYWENLNALLQEIQADKDRN